jgi:antitoxin (DNA-binding transcriptional repressor) of toxin-antitoxin stability system
MRKVGSREFNKHMGKYMRAVRGGQSLLLTIRGKVVAWMSPLKDTQASASTLDERLKELESQGLIHLATKPLGKFRAVKSRGKSASRMLIEDRR